MTISIELILHDAVEHSREKFKAKAGNKYYCDKSVLDEKDSYKRFIHSGGVKKRGQEEFLKSRAFISNLEIEEERRQASFNEILGNDLYKRFYQGILHGGKMSESSKKDRESIRAEFRQRDLINQLINKDENEINAEQYRKIYDYTVEKQNELLAGNCPDYCNAAYHYLIQQRVDDILSFYNAMHNTPSYVYVQIIATQGKYDHVFILINSFNNKKGQPILGQLYHELPRGAWVCDPWAKIVCCAEDYNDRWKSKMSKWHLLGKCLVLSSNDSNQFPLKKDTYLTIQNSVKKILNQAIISPDGNITARAL
ncbi:hypothetical protein FE392_07595 [Xenorhabdus sp. 12]|uniref:Uncharacterized protein n=1 Tax=Xenorhabdus santafensis TaxID=2582833 RepID=A0ABU4S8S2_9GAMM|nr:hypothetical protein [Xenorhabdus sp. 12]MDX7987194.1 hypothetical protein [Xenorhabdus sp. 12]